MPLDLVLFFSTPSFCFSCSRPPPLSLSASTCRPQPRAAPPFVSIPLALFCLCCVGLPVVPPHPSISCRFYLSPRPVLPLSSYPYFSFCLSSPPLLLLLPLILPALFLLLCLYTIPSYFDYFNSHCGKNRIKACKIQYCLPWERKRGTMCRLYRRLATWQPHRNVDSVVRGRASAQSESPTNRPLRYCIWRIRCTLSH